MAVYGKRRLRDDEFRVLQLDHSSSVLRGELEVVKFSWEDQYATLSYAWDQEPSQGCIRLGSSMLKVSGTVEKALWRLRDLGVNRVWIDQVSINQGNIQERNQQVSRMKDIYRGGQKCFVYLGDGTGRSEDVDLLVQYVERMRRTLMIGVGKQIVANFTKKRTEHPDDDDKSEDRVKYYSTKNKRPDSCIDYLMSQKYFSRTWVLQEILASRQVTCLLGPKTLPWDILRSLALEIPLTRSHASNKAAQRRVRLANLPELSTWRAIGRVKGDSKDLMKAEALETFNRFIMLTADSNGQNLFTLLQSARTLQATDPRDKIFALLNIATDANKYPKADYSLSTNEVYRHYAAALMENGHELGVLAVSGTVDSRRPHWPSWIPRWNEPQADFSWETGTTFCAGGTRVTRPRCIGRKVRVRAYIYDTIRFRSPPVRFASFYRDLARFVDDLVNVIHQTEVYDRKLDLVRSLVQLLLCDPSKHDEVAFLQDTEEVFDLPGLKKRWRSLVHIFEDFRNDENKDSMLWRLFEDDESNTGDQVARDFLNELTGRSKTENYLRQTTSTYISNRGISYLKYLQGKVTPICVVSLFKHRDSSYNGKLYEDCLGLAPSTCQLGDKVVIVRGTRAPFILRECGPNRYQNLGQAYVRGIMNGEKAATLSRDDYQYVDIV